MTNPENLELDITRKNLRIAIAMRSLNGSEVSRRAGMSRNGIGQFIDGRTSISYQNLKKVCGVLELPIGVVHKNGAITESYLQNVKEVLGIPEHELQTLLDVRDALHRNKALSD